MVSTFLNQPNDHGQEYNRLRLVCAELNGVWATSMTALPEQWDNLRRR